MDIMDMTWLQSVNSSFYGNCKHKKLKETITPILHAYCHSFSQGKNNK